MNVKSSPGQKSQTSTPPFCISCANFIPADHPDNQTKQVPVCRYCQMLDLVTGTKFFPACIEMRNPQAPCGTEGKLFKPKGDLDKPKNVTPMIEPDKTSLN